ncbi:MAG: hypothetical protein V1744_08460 [Candidatus Altiarchaeota archaeon]
MAKVAAVAWFPRSYIQLFQTYSGLERIDLKVKDVEYDGRTVSFTIVGYKNYPEIRFTQGWSGLHYFVVELPDEGVEVASDNFMKEMQVLLLERILKACHTVTYKQVVSDMLPLDFHRIVLTRGTVNTNDLPIKDAGGMKVAYKPQDIYSSGTVSYVLGTDDTSLLKVLLFHAYVEVGCDFLRNMLMAMVRLYHDADTIVEEVEAAREYKQTRKSLDVMEDIINESTNRGSKISHMNLSFRLKEQEFNNTQFSQQEKALAQALEIGEHFMRIRADGEYMDILWDMMDTKVKNLISIVNLRLKIKDDKKKGWF